MLRDDWKEIRTGMNYALGFLLTLLTLGVTVPIIGLIGYGIFTTLVHRP